MPSTSGLSDKAIALFAFAAYHQLESGQPVTSVVRADGNGHKADEEAVSELQQRGLATTKGNDLSFTPEGLEVLAKAVDELKAAARSACP